MSEYATVNMSRYQCGSTTMIIGEWDSPIHAPVAISEEMIEHIENADRMCWSLRIIGKQPGGNGVYVAVRRDAEMSDGTLHQLSERLHLEPLTDEFRAAHESLCDTSFPHP